MGASQRVNVSLATHKPIGEWSMMNYHCRYRNDKAHIIQHLDISLKLGNVITAAFKCGENACY